MNNEYKLQNFNHFLLTCNPKEHYISSICLVNSKTKHIFIGTKDKSGFKNGSIEESLFKEPQGLIVSKAGDLILLCDTGNHCIRKICRKTGQVSTFAGVPKQMGLVFGDIKSVNFIHPTNLQFSNDEQFVFVTDCFYRRVCVICLKTNNLMPIATYLSKINL